MSDPTFDTRSKETRRALADALHRVISEAIGPHGTSILIISFATDDGIERHTMTNMVPIEEADVLFTAADLAQSEAEHADTEMTGTLQ